LIEQENSELNARLLEDIEAVENERTFLKEQFALVEGQLKIEAKLRENVEKWKRRMENASESSATSSSSNLSDPHPDTTPI